MGAGGTKDRWREHAITESSNCRGLVPPEKQGGKGRNVQPKYSGKRFNQTMVKEVPESGTKSS